MDAEDLELVEENTGTRVDRSRTHGLSRLRRGRASASASPPPVTKVRHPELSEDDSNAESADVTKIFDDTGRGARGGPDDIDLDDEDDGFIDDDDDEDLDREMGEEEREERRREKRRDERQRRRAMGARPELAGIDAAAWDEVWDVFGLGTEYDWALDNDEDLSDHEREKELKYQDVRLTPLHVGAVKLI